MSQCLLRPLPFSLSVEEPSWIPPGFKGWKVCCMWPGSSFSLCAQLLPLGVHFMNVAGPALPLLAWYGTPLPWKYMHPGNSTCTLLGSACTVRRPLREYMHMLLILLAQRIHALSGIRMVLGCRIACTAFATKPSLEYTVILVTLFFLSSLCVFKCVLRYYEQTYFAFSPLCVFKYVLKYYEQKYFAFSPLCVFNCNHTNNRMYSVYFIVLGWRVACTLLSPLNPNSPTAEHTVILV